MSFLFLRAAFTQDTVEADFNLRFNTVMVVSESLIAQRGYEVELAFS